MDRGPVDVASPWRSAAVHVTIDRQVLYLTLFVVRGLCLTQCLQSSHPVGRNVSGLPVLAAILAGGGSPETVQGSAREIKAICGQAEDPELRGINPAHTASRARRTRQQRERKF